MCLFDEAAILNRFCRKRDSVALKGLKHNGGSSRLRLVRLVKRVASVQFILFVLGLVESLDDLGLLR